MNALIAYTSIQCDGVFTGFTGFAIRSFPDGELPPFQSLTLQPSGLLEFSNKFPPDPTPLGALPHAHCKCKASRFLTRSDSPASLLHLAAASGEPPAICYPHASPAVQERRRALRSLSTIHKLKGNYYEKDHL